MIRTIIKSFGLLVALSITVSAFADSPVYESLCLVEKPAKYGLYCANFKAFTDTGYPFIDGAEHYTNVPNDTWAPNEREHRVTQFTPTSQDRTDSTWNITEYRSNKFGIVSRIINFDDEAHTLSYVETIDGKIRTTVNLAKCEKLAPQAPISSVTLLDLCKAKIEKEEKSGNQN